MKILAITNLYPNPLQPHIAPWNRAQLCALAKRHSIRVIAPVLWTEEWSARRSRSVRIFGDRRSVCDGIVVDHPRYYYPPKVLRNTYGQCFRWSVKQTFQQAVRQFAPDVVYASWAYPDGWAACRLAAEAGLPVVVRCLGSDILSLERCPRRLRLTVEALQHADIVITVSRDLADNVVRRGVPEAKVRVVYNGVNTNVFRPGSRRAARRLSGIPENQPTILYVGNLVEVKQVDALLEACGMLHAAGDSFHCHVLGDGPLRESLAELARQLGLSDHVTFHGLQPQVRLVDWYRSANVVVLPSRSEGIPNVLLEAAACGVPFVASCVGGIPEIDAKDRCRLVPSGDVAALAKAVRPFLNDDLAFTEPLPRACGSWEESAVGLEEVLSLAVERYKDHATAPIPADTSRSQHRHRRKAFVVQATENSIQ